MKGWSLVGGILLNQLTAVWICGSIDLELKKTYKHEWWIRRISELHAGVTKSETDDVTYMDILRRSGKELTVKIFTNRNLAYLYL